MCDVFGCDTVVDEEDAMAFDGIQVLWREGIILLDDGHPRFLTIYFLGLVFRVTGDKGVPGHLSWNRQAHQGQDGWGKVTKCSINVVNK